MFKSARNPDLLGSDSSGLIIYRLAKPPLKFRGGLANLRVNFIGKTDRKVLVANYE